MKIISIRKKTIFKASAILLFTMIICIFTNSFGMQHYYKVDFSTGLVTATTLNVRSGPGTYYGIVATVREDDMSGVSIAVLQNVEGKSVVETMSPEFVGFIGDAYRSLKYTNHLEKP